MAAEGADRAMQFMYVAAASGLMQAIHVLGAYAGQYPPLLPFRQDVMPLMGDHTLQLRDAHRVKIMEEVVIALQRLDGGDRSRIDIAPPSAGRSEVFDS